jgi:hypothetical protein
MIVECNGWLIDTTLYQINRPVWAHLPGMISLPIIPTTNKAYNKRGLAVMQRSDGHGYVCTMAWLDDEKNKTWLHAPDRKRERRIACVRALFNEFRSMEEQFVKSLEQLAERENR